MTGSIYDLDVTTVNLADVMQTFWGLTVEEAEEYMLTLNDTDSRLLYERGTEVMDIYLPDWEEGYDENRLDVQLDSFFYSDSS